MIIVFGSLNMDLVMSVDRFPRVGETLLCDPLSSYPGGKGANQAVAAARSGGEVRFFGRVGEDHFGDVMRQTLRSEGINIEGVACSPLPTGCASIWVNRAGDNSILVASGANQDVRASDVPDALLTPDTLVLLQMEVPLEENWKLVKRASECGARVLLNNAPSGPIPPEILPLLGGLILNEGEASALGNSLGMVCGDLPSLSRLLTKTYGLWVTITRGSQGAILSTSHHLWEAPGLMIRPVDTTAAGDTFAGTFAAFLSLGHELSACFHYGVVAGGLACLTRGAIPSIPDREAILKTGKKLAAVCHVA